MEHLKIIQVQILGFPFIATYPLKTHLESQLYLGCML